MATNPTPASGIQGGAGGQTANDANGGTGLPPTEPMSPQWVRGLVIYYVALPIVLIILLVKLWPPCCTSSTPCAASSVTLYFASFGIYIPADVLLLLIVLLSGALGSYVHGATSLVVYTGTRTSLHSWRWWYVLRPFIGMAMALGFYFVVSGYVANNLNREECYKFATGLAGMAFLVGMFSKQAASKLADIFDTLFRVPPEKEIKDKSDTSRPPSGTKPGDSSTPPSSGGATPPTTGSQSSSATEAATAKSSDEEKKT